MERRFESNVKSASRNRFSSTRGDNWQDKIYKECGRDAVDRELDNIGNECLTDPDAGSDCNWFGKEVARLIVRQAGLCDNWKKKSADRLEQFLYNTSSLLCFIHSSSKLLNLTQPWMLDLPTQQVQLLPYQLPLVEPCLQIPLISIYQPASQSPW